VRHRVPSGSERAITTYNLNYRQGRSFVVRLFYFIVVANIKAMFMSKLLSQLEISKHVQKAHDNIKLARCLPVSELNMRTYLSQIVFQYWSNYNKHVLF